MEELRKKNLRPSVKYDDDGTVMVCVCMAASRVRSLHCIEGIINKHVYVNILREHLKASTEKPGIQEHCVIYHDNDPKHSSHLVRQWYLYNCSKVIKTPP